jgi:hypothetical protein
MSKWNMLKEQKRLCKLWIENPLQNPETGLPIKRNGPTFMKWKEKCQELELIDKKSRSRSAGPNGFELSSKPKVQVNTGIQLGPVVNNGNEIELSIH